MSQDFGKIDSRQDMNLTRGMVNFSTFCFVFVVNADDDEQNKVL
jgi:hypothetical protein